MSQDVNYRNARLCFRFIDFHREWKKCRVKLDVIRSIVCGCVMLFVKTCLIPLHESCTRIVTSPWLHSCTWVWHWTFILLIFAKHQQPGMKRAKFLLGRRDQPAYVNPYFLLTARLLWDLIGRTVNIQCMRARTTFYYINPYPTAFPYGNGMVLHFYQQQESSTTKTVHKVINKGLKTYV